MAADNPCRLQTNAAKLPDQKVKKNRFKAVTVART